MAERATIFQGIQIGPETVPGTAVPATKKLTALSFTIGAKVNTKKYRASGSKFANIVVPTKQWTTLGVSGPITYTEIIYPLASLLGYRAPVEANGVQNWSFWANNYAPDPQKTFTVEQGTYERAHRIAHALITGLELTFNREGCEISGGDGIARALEDDIHMSTDAVYSLTAAAVPPTTGTFTLTYLAQTTAAIQYNATPAQVEAALEALSTIGVGNVEVVGVIVAGAGDLSVALNKYHIEFIGALAQAPQTLTGTFTGLTPASSITLASVTTGAAPTELDLIPVLATDVSVYLADTQAGLDAALPLQRAMSCTWRVGDRNNPVYPLNRAIGKSFVTTVEVEPAGEVKLSMVADAEGMALYEAMGRGDKKFMRIEAIGEDAVEGFPYKFVIDSSMQVESVSDFKDEEGLFAIEWTFTLIHDPVWGKSTQVDVVNLLTSL